MHGFGPAACNKLDAGYGQLHAPVVSQQRRVGAQLVHDELNPVPEALRAVARAIIKCSRACRFKHVRACQMLKLSSIPQAPWLIVLQGEFF